MTTQRQRPRPPVQSYPTQRHDSVKLRQDLDHDMRQAHLATLGKAKGQCQDRNCWAYSWTGKPPVFHTRQCKAA